MVEMSPLFNQTQLQLIDVMNPAAVHTLLQLFPADPVVYRVEIRTVGWPESWSDQVLCSRVFCTVMHVLWEGALS